MVKKGSKMPRPRLLVHAAARVRDRELDVGPGLHGHVARRVLLVELDVGGLDGELASLGHGVAGVDHEVHEHLLDLARVGQRQAEVGREHLHEVDVLAEDPPEHLLDPRGDLVQAQRHGLQAPACG